MAFLESNEIESLVEDEESLDEPEGWEREGFGAAEALPRYRRSYTRQGRTPVRAPAPARPVGALTGGVINTPAGQANVRFDKPVATKESIDNVVKELKNEIRLQAEAIKKVDQLVDQNTAILDKKFEAMRRAQSQGQMMSMLPLLLSKPPSLEKIRFTATTPARAINTGDEVDATGTFKKDDNSILLIALLGGMGGLGGDSSESSGMNTLLLALALTGGFGGK